MLARFKSWFSGKKLKITDLDMSLLEEEPNNPPLFDSSDEKAIPTSSEAIAARLTLIKKKLEPSFCESLYPDGLRSKQFAKDIFCFSVCIALLAYAAYLFKLMNEEKLLFGKEKDSFDTDMQEFVNQTGTLINTTCQNLTKGYLYKPSRGCEYALNQTSTPQDISDHCSSYIETMCKFLKEANDYRAYGVIAIAGGVLIELYYAIIRVAKRTRLGIGLSPEDIIVLESQRISSLHNDPYERREDFLKGINLYFSRKDTVPLSPKKSQVEIEVVEENEAKKAVVATLKN